MLQKLEEACKNLRKLFQTFSIAANYVKWWFDHYITHDVMHAKAKIISIMFHPFSCAEDFVEALQVFASLQHLILHTWTARFSQ